MRYTAEALLRQYEARRAMDGVRDGVHTCSEERQ